MGYATVITQPLLNVAGIPDSTLSAMLVGLTVAAAADILETVFALRGAGQLIDNGGMVSYSINGQSTTFSIDDAERTLAWIRRLKSPGGGPARMGMQLP